DQAGAPVRAVGADESELAASVAVQHEVLSQNPHLLGRMARQLRRGSDRVPIAAEQPPHRRLGPDLRQSLVVLLRQHKNLSAKVQYRSSVSASRVSLFEIISPRRPTG